MKSSRRRWVKVLKFIAYPAFYVFCLGLFGYLAFPWNQLKDRLISEFDKQQRKGLRRPGDKPMRLEIDDLDSYWVTGIEINGAKLHIPAKPKKSSKSKGLAGFGGSPAKAEPPPKDAVVRIDTLTASVRFWSLLGGDVVIDFDAEAFGGEIEGTVPVGVSTGDVEIEFAGLQLMDVEPLQGLLEGVPLQGVADGTLKLTPKEGKFAKADGAVNIAINGVKLGKPQKNEDGKMEDVVEIQGIKVPSILVGTINLDLTAKDGGLKLSDLSAKSADFELLGEGSIKLNEAWDRSRAEMFLQFKFTDEYRVKSPAATSLLGKPGDKRPLIELDSNIKRSKTPEGFYRFRISGPLGNLNFTPAGSTGSRTTLPRTNKRRTVKPRSRPRTRPKPKTAGGDDDSAPRRTRPRPRPKPVSRPAPVIPDAEPAQDEPAPDAPDAADAPPEEAPPEEAAPEEAAPEEAAPEGG